MKPELTEHASIRMRQRGIDSQVLECLLTYGSAVHDHRGAQVLLFDKRAWRRMERAVDRAVLKRATESRGLYAVRSLDGNVVTIGHRFRRVRRD